MAKHKIRQFAELDNFENVIQHLQNSATINNLLLKGKWQQDFFKNTNPIVLELGCGKGEYTVNMGREFTNTNFIGADLKGNRLWTGAKTALEEKLNNVGFLRTRIENITTAFAPNEVSEIWVTFPDPYPQLPRARKRLISSQFLKRYQQILKPKGLVHLKTDNAFLYNFASEVIAENNFNVLIKTDNLYQEPDGFLGPNHQLLVGIKTHYEKLFTKKGFSIHYIQFQIN